MAGRLAGAGTDLVVWSRDPDKSVPGALRAASPAEVFAHAGVVIVMLANGDVIDRVLDRGTPAFSRLVAGHTIVHMGTTAPHYSAALAEAVRHAGGRYVEAPVSGSRGPAGAGQLVAMMAGDPEDISGDGPITGRGRH